uniref:RGS domain-containing protein n=1 Tax=Globodera pallida TaxID=36090 RepID=A0A183CAZ2_GLOPA
MKNFNFVLKLSEFSLSYYEAYKVLEAILIESNAASNSAQQQQPYLLTNDQPPPAAEVHTFLKQYFIAKLDTKSMKMKQYMLSKFGSSKVNKVDCAFVRFGRELERRLVEDYSRICHPDFSEYAQRMEKECGREDSDLEMELFHEPLRNYARAIQIDSHACKGIF